MKFSFKIALDMLGNEKINLPIMEKELYIILKVEDIKGSSKMISRMEKLP